jgi:hypothetical protein
MRNGKRIVFADMTQKEFEAWLIAQASLYTNVDLFNLDEAAIRVAANGGAKKRGGAKKVRTGI